MSTRRAPSPLFVAQVAACLLFVGCAGKSLPTHVWTLRPSADAKAKPAASGATIGLQSFTAEAGLRSTSLSWREGEDAERRHYPYHEWLDYPDVILFGLTKDALIKAGSDVKASPPRQGRDAILSCRLTEFDEWDSADKVEVRLGLRWRLERPDGTLIAEGRAERRREAKAKEVAAVVEAFEAATNEALSELVTDALAALASADSAQGS